MLKYHWSTVDYNVMIFVLVRVSIDDFFISSVWNHPINVKPVSNVVKCIYHVIIVRWIDVKLDIWRKNTKSKQIGKQKQRTTYIYWMSNNIKCHLSGLALPKICFDFSFLFQLLLFIYFNFVFTEYKTQNWLFQLFVHNSILFFLSTEKLFLLVHVSWIWNMSVNVCVIWF